MDQPPLWVIACRAGRPAPDVYPCKVVGVVARHAAMKPDILCIGSVLWDIIGRADRTMALGADVPGRITRLPGGVAMNIAMTLARLGLHPALLTAIGTDSEGDDLVGHANALGLETAFIHRTPRPTDRYMAIEGANGLIAAIADAHSLELAGADILLPLANGALGSVTAPWPGLIALDGNLTESLIAQIAQSPAFAAADLRVAPASPGKAGRLAPLLLHPRATFYVNLEEANILTGGHAITAADAAAAMLHCGASRVLVTHGPAPAACGAQGQDVLSATPPRIQARRITGAGDTFMAAHIVAERNGAARADALQQALQAAASYVAAESTGK
jgi:sugar/nucleoside kinase (ribokinase family)